MTNLEKMNELVGSNARKDQVIEWAYMNRVFVADLPKEPEFVEMKNSVKSFMRTVRYTEEMMRDERATWNKFLDEEFIE